MRHLVSVSSPHFRQAEDGGSHAPIGLIRAEHEAILECFNRIGAEAQTEEEAVSLIQRLCDQFTLYLSLKEEVVLPALRNLPPEASLSTQIDEAVVEHFCLKILLETLDGQGFDDELFHAKISVLQRHFIRHVALEQRFLFPLISHAPLDLEFKMLEHKEKLRKEDRRDQY